MKIVKTNSNFERELLIRPFGFKGGYMTECWQTVAFLENEMVQQSVGLCTQNILWSDSAVFAKHSEAGGNALMYAMLDYGLSRVKGFEFSDPIGLLDYVWPLVYEYGQKITGSPHLRETFALNALVGLDFAAWLLHAKENNIKNFDNLIPTSFKLAFSHKHSAVASIPLAAYAIPIDDISQMVKDGYFIMKIKIGSPGQPEEMLEWDKKRLTEIHRTIGEQETQHTESGKIPYYFDANGRYPNKDYLKRFLDHADKLGALEQIAIVEEPFPEDYKIDVHDLPVRIAADESAHTDKDAIERIDLGYSAIALKPIAKTLSMTMKIANEAHKRNIPCFCADLTVNPILVEWNKNVAARLAPIPGLSIGLVESNGHQNYQNWERMKSHQPFGKATWANTSSGVFELDDDFYEKNGGIFEISEHYKKLVD